MKEKVFSNCYENASCMNIMSELWVIKFILFIYRTMNLFRKFICLICYSKANNIHSRVYIVEVEGN